MSSKDKENNHLKVNYANNRMRKKESLNTPYEEVKISKHIQEMDEYVKLITDMYTYNIRENKSDNYYVNVETKTDSNKKDLDKSSRTNAKSFNQKVSQNENSENKHVFQQIIQKAMDHLVDKKSLHVLTDDISNEESSEENSNKKIEVLLSKMMDDKTLINDKTFSNNVNDSLITQIFMAMSPDAKKLILENNSSEKEREIQSFFHHLIGFNYDKFVEDPLLTNEIMISINNNIVRIDEMYNHKEEENYVEEINYNLLSKNLEEVIITNENKLVFEEDKKFEMEKEKSFNNKIVRAANIILEGVSNKEEKDKLQESIDLAKEFAINNLIGLMKSHEFEKENMMEIINTVNNNQELDQEAKVLFNEVINEANLGKENPNKLEYDIRNDSLNNKKEENNVNKIVETLGNPFENTYENNLGSNKGSKQSLNTKTAKKKEIIKEEIPSNSKVSKVKNGLQLDEKDKKKMIKINNNKPKFSHFENEDSDW